MIKVNSFKVSFPKTNRSVCWSCHKEILKEDIRIQQKHIAHYENFHLLCYRPKYHQYINLKMISIDLDSYSLKDFKNWLENWNVQFRSNNSIDLRIRLFKKSFFPVKIKNQRMWVEVLKFLPGIEIIQNLSLVNKTFYNLSWNNELFKSLCITEFSSNLQYKCFHSLYICLYEESCFSCHSFDTSLKYQRLSHNQRNICKNCKVNFIDVGDIKQKFRIHPAKFGIKLASARRGVKLCERLRVEKAAVVWRKKLKEKVFRYFGKNCKIGFKGFVRDLDRFGLRDLDEDLMMMDRVGQGEVAVEVLRKVLDFVYKTGKKITLKDILREYVENQVNNKEETKTLSNI